MVLSSDGKRLPVRPYKNWEYDRELPGLKLLVEKTKGHNRESGLSPGVLVPVICDTSGLVTC
jgi:hypothetical protein